MAIDSSKFFDSIRIKPNKLSAKAQARAREEQMACEWAGCQNKGPHRAPKGRENSREYWHFCLDHVREYNQSYNFFQGMNPEDVARYQKDALTGHRPTWKMGANGDARYSPDQAQKRSGRAGYYSRIRDPFGMFGDRAGQPPRQRTAKPLEAKALETLGLDTKATGADIKSRYKELVKRHHPDANGGDRGSEDRFRDVLQAYRVLKQAGLC